MQLKQYIATIDFDIHSPETPWAVYFDDFLQCRFHLLRAAEYYIADYGRLIKFTSKAKKARVDYVSDFQSKYVEIEE